MISVLMSNFNKSSYIEDAIKSVLKQTCGDWELIIIDDFSSDNSMEKLNLFSFDKKIKIFKNNKNLGTISTLKKMISFASSDILLILDSDDTLEKNAIKEVSDVFEKHSDVGFVYSYCNYCDADLKPYKKGSSRISENQSNINGNKVTALRAFRIDSYNMTSGLDSECIFAEDFDLTLKFEEVTKIYFIEKVLYNYRILKKSQTHGFKNEMINRSSVCLAKLKAYQRRRGLKIKNLNETQLFEILIWGAFSSLLSSRIKQLKIFIVEASKRFYIIFNPFLYFLLIKKVYKIIMFKTNKI